MQPTNDALHLPQDVTKNREWVLNLNQVTIPSSDAPHQPYAHSAPHLLHDVNKSKKRVPNLTSEPYLTQMQPTNGALHLPQDVTKNREWVPNLKQVTTPSSDAPHQPYDLGAPHLLHDVIKSKMRVPNLTREPYLPQMQHTKQWCSSLSTGCNQK